MSRVKSRSKKATEERREKLANLREQLAEFEAQLEPEQLAFILACHAGYSQRNACLIAMQRPDATEVAGYRAWQDRSRQVRKGETGIQILAPMPSRGEEPEDGNDAEGKKLRFRLAFVFDITQTDPIGDDD